jgi:hypothetical protein
LPRCIAIAKAAAPAVVITNAGFAELVNGASRRPPSPVSSAEPSSAVPPCVDDCSLVTGDIHVHVDAMAAWALAGTM